MTFNIAFFADDHLYYKAGRKDDSRGINLREADGYRAFAERVSAIVDFPEKIDAVIHGGDLFHVSHPSIRAIATAQHYLRELSRAGIPFYGVAGNHDASDNRSVLPSVAAVDDRSKNIYAFYQPYEKLQIADGIVLHAVAHHGLSGDAAPVVEPVQGSLNIFTTHGAALDPKNATLLRCQDSPREQIIPPEMVLDENFIVRLLGHYHSMYAVGGVALNTWYAGSSIRRGFSDEPGRRGWLLVKVEVDGTVEVIPQDIYQRPQYDLEIIDASDLTGAEVQERIEAALIGTRSDDIDAAFNEITAPIVRQRVINASRSIREGMDKRRIDRLTKHTMMWQLEFMRPVVSAQILAEKAKQEEGENLEQTSTASLLSSFNRDIVGQFDAWSSETGLEGIPQSLRNNVIAGAQEHLRRVSAKDAKV